MHFPSDTSASHGGKGGYARQAWGLPSPWQRLPHGSARPEARSLRPAQLLPGAAGCRFRLALHPFRAARAAIGCWGRRGPAFTSGAGGVGKMAAAAAEVRRLQARLEALERRVLGPGAGGPRKVRGSAPGHHHPFPRVEALRLICFSLPLQLADGLVKVQVVLGNVASKRERVKILFKKSKRTPATPGGCQDPWMRVGGVMGAVKTPSWAGGGG